MDNIFLPKYKKVKKEKLRPPDWAKLWLPTGQETEFFLWTRDEEWEGVCGGGVGGGGKRRGSEKADRGGVQVAVGVGKGRGSSNKTPALGQC